MGETSNTFVFEDRNLADLYARFQPGRVVTFETLVLRLLEDERCPAEERDRLILQQRQPDESEAQLRLNFATIETMREAQIITDEHVEYAFAELPPSPKNARLKELFNFYLTSDLVRDWTFLVWSLVEHLKDGIFKNPFTKHLTFVPAASPSALFLEAARAFAYAQNVDEVSTIPFHELGSSEGIRRPLVLEGAVVDSIDRLVARLAREKGPVYVAFGGDASETAYFRLKLAHAGIPFPAADAPATDLLARVRADRNLELKDRLRLGSLLIENRRRLERHAPDTIPEKLEAWAVVSPSERDYLKKLSPLAGSAFPESRLTLLTAIAYPPMADFLPHYYLGEGFWNPQKPDSLLKESEINALGRAGFTLQAPPEPKAQLSSILETRAVRSVVFAGRRVASLLPTERVRTLRNAAPERTPLDESYAVDVPPARVSASQLEAFARCPSYFLFANRLGLRRRKFLDEEAYSLLFGQAVHLTLERNFIVNKGQHFKEVESIFRGALATLAPLLTADDPYHVILCESFRKIAVNLPTMEEQLRALAGGSVQAAAELKFEFPLDTLVLSGKIDRIDRLQNGELLVLDYKTGNVDFTPEHIAQGSHFQALIYLLAVEKKFPEPVAGVLFYDLKKAEVRRGIVVQEGLPAEAKKLLTRGHLLLKEKFDEIKERGLAELGRLVALIRAGDFTPTPSTKACNHCDFPSFCRRGDLL